MAVAPAAAEDALRAEITALSAYTPGEITADPALRRRWWEMTWQAWPQGGVEIDFSDFDERRWFDAPPAPGVHPRLLLRPEQLAEIRAKLRTGAAGQVAWRRHRLECDHLRTKPGVSALYAALVAGESGSAVDELFKAHAYETALRMSWESLRILIEEDAAAGRELAAAMQHYARRLDAIFVAKSIGVDRYINQHVTELPAYMRTKTLGHVGYQEIAALFQEYALPLMYDFNHAYLDPSQRDEVRAMIAKLSTDMWIHGMGTADTGGNWGPHHWKGANAALVIEGEPGFDPDTVAGLKQVMGCLYATDFTPDGMIWEGLGKGTFGAQGLPLAALRGWDMAGSQRVRRAVSEVMIHARQPFSDALITLGGLGSSRSRIGGRLTDLVVMRHLYPDDPVIAYLYRVAVGEGYATFDQPYSTHYAGIRGPLFRVLWCSDVDTSVDRDAAFAALERPLSAFCPQFSMLSARTSWERDAAWVYTWCRAMNYGHSRNDRGAFVFSALGREWVSYPWGRGGNAHGSAYDAATCSVMTVDGLGTQGLPAKTIAHADGPLMSAVTYDLRHSWDWREGRKDAMPDRLDPTRFVDFAVLDDERPGWAYVPRSLYPHWRHPGALTGADLRVPHAPVRHAFRSVALVRGAQPYLLVSDDLQRDDAQRLYRWHLSLPDDLVLERVAGDDVYLIEGDPPADGAARRRLQLRIAQSGATGRGADAVVDVRIEAYEGAVTNRRSSRRLTLCARAPAVRFKVLLRAIGPGDEPIETEWSGDVLTVRIGDQVDRIDTASDAEGCAGLRLERAGATAALDPVHHPLPGAAPPGTDGRGYEP